MRIKVPPIALQGNLAHKKTNSPGSEVPLYTLNLIPQHEMINPTNRAAWKAGGGDDTEEVEGGAAPQS